MNYNELLNRLIENRMNSVVNNPIYQQYCWVLYKVEQTLENFRNIESLTDEDLKLFVDQSISSYVKGIKYYSQQSYDETEIRSAIEKLINKILADKDNNEVMKKMETILKETESIKMMLIENNIDEKIIMNFVKKCYEDKLISLEQLIGLNLHIGMLKMRNLSLEDEEEEQILEENEVSIVEELKIIFAKYGYDYDEINFSKKNRKKIEQYGKIDYIDYVLSIFKDNDITSDMIEDRQGVVCDIFLARDGEALNKIVSFVKENDCSLYDMFEMGSIFHKRKKKLIFKNNERTGTPPGGESQVISGDQDSFFKNIELYKQYKNLPKDYKMLSEDFKNRVEFFTAPNFRILYNLSILEEYKLISPNTLPDKLSFLGSANVSYLLDRCIESNLYNYCSRNMSILGENAESFRWYKIKRAIDLQQNLMRAGGLRGELRSKDAEFCGIGIRTEGNEVIIEQTNVGHEIIEQGNKKLSSSLLNSYSKHTPIEKMPLVQFNWLYKYKVFEIDEIFKHTNLSKSSITMIKTVLNRKNNFNREQLNFVTTDPFIKMLDETIMTNEQGDRINCKIDDLRYRFVSPSFEGHEIIISRKKVLQLVGELKKHNLWINEKTDFKDKVNLMISVLLKDSVVSISEQSMVRFEVNRILKEYLEKMKSRGVM